MIVLDARMAAAIKELDASGAVNYLVEQMAFRALEDSLENKTLRDDREFRARMANIKGFDSEIMRTINGMRTD